MNYSTLDPPTGFSTPLKSYGQPYNQWEGQRSDRFGRSIRFEAKRDIIKKNFDLPNQTQLTGRVHFNQSASIEKPFRSSVYKVPPIKHWHLRESKIRTMDFKPTERLRRAEQVHHNMIRHNPEDSRPESLRTFYRDNRNTEVEYSVEDRMQRKTRIDQVELRKTFYRGLNIFNR